MERGSFLVNLGTQMRVVRLSAKNDRICVGQLILLDFAIRDYNAAMGRGTAPRRAPFGRVCDLWQRRLAAWTLIERRWFLERLSYTPVGWCKPLDRRRVVYGDSHHLLVSARLTQSTASKLTKACSSSNYYAARSS